MKNSDMPAQPVSVGVNSSGDIFDSFDVGAFGLTKREHFAGLAMQGYIARGHELEFIIRDSIDTADELLKELDKEG